MSVMDVNESSVRLLRLVADPQRWRLLEELAGCDRRVGELTELLGAPQNLVSYHLGELRAAGLVSARRSSADGRDVYYRADLARCAELLVGVGAALHPSVRLGPAPPASAPTRRGRPRVLFLCTGNSARSQIAEALLEHTSGGAIEARSAGSHPKPLHANAVRVLAERGIDISGRSTKHWSRLGRARFDRVVTLCDKVKEICPELPNRPATAHWSIVDPAAGGGSDADTYPTFVRTADEIDVRIGVLLAEMNAPPSHRRSPHARP